MSLTKSQVNAVTKEMEAALQAIIEKHGMQSVRMAGGNFHDTGFTVKFEVKAEKPEDDTTMQAYFKLLGLPADSFGKQFSYGGSTFEITGVDLKKQKYPVLGKNVRTGKGFKFNADDVKRSLGLSVKNGLPANTLVKRPVPGEGMTDEIFKKFESLATRLSPENLSCDGELNKIQIGMRKSQIMKEWNALEREIGRNVPLSEFPI